MTSHVNNSQLVTQVRDTLLWPKIAYASHVGNEFSHEILTRRASDSSHVYNYILTTTSYTRSEIISIYLSISPAMFLFFVLSDDRLAFFISLSSTWHSKKSSKAGYRTYKVNHNTKVKISYRWKHFLSSPHVVGRAYCSHSVSFLPSVSTVYEVSIGFIWRHRPSSCPLDHGAVHVI